MRRGVGVLIIGVALVALAGVATAGGAPIVSPGLDQDVTLGDTVYLDGGGTHVPEGELDSLEWSIETPDGRTVTPDCVDCEQTSFTPNETGQYKVTLTALSESGVERSDTLYVTVGVASETSDPEMESSGGGNGGGSGCYIAYEANDNPMDHGVCNYVGDVVDTELGGGGNYIESVIVTDEGDLTDEFSGVERTDDGRWRIDYDVMESETDDLYEDLKEDNDNTLPSNQEGNGRNSGGGSNDSDGGSDPGSDDDRGSNTTPPGWWM